MTSVPVIVIGAGGHAKVVVNLLLAQGRSVLAVVDKDGSAQKNELLGIPLRIGDQEILAHEPSQVDLALGIGMTADEPIISLGMRSLIAKRFQARGYFFPNLIHPSAIIGVNCHIDDGAQIMAGAILQPCCTVGSFAIINTHASLDHDCVVGDSSHVAPSVTLGGSVCVGSESLIGIGASVRQSILVGDRALVAGGAMVTKNVGSGEVFAGVPARRLA